MNIKKIVKEVIIQTAGEIGVNMEDNLKTDIGLDSLSLVGVIVGIEEKLGIMFDESDLDPVQLQTVKDLVMLAEKYI